VVVVAGVEIGDGCVVGAGAVVTHSLPPGAVAVGVPARVVSHRAPAGRQGVEAGLRAVAALEGAGVPT
jgi:acetyltransferase-like isoleucine patch superfamily enzyme